MSTNRRSSIALSVAAIAAVLLIAAADSPPASRPQGWPTPEQWQVALDRDKEIAAELATLDRASLADDDWTKEWAGTYYTRAGVFGGRSISIAPKSGMVYTSSGCFGPDGANIGEIADAFPGGIKVKLSNEPVEGPNEFMSSKLFFVRWGDQRYLVPERHLQHLVVQYNAGGTERERMYGIPRREPDSGPRNFAPQSAPPGRPQLPAEFAAMIIEKPTRLKITSVKAGGPAVALDGGRTSYVRGQIELAGGRDRGLFVGTRIDCARSDRDGAIQLDRVDDTKSSGTFSVNLRSPTAQPLEAGAEVLLPGAEPELPTAK